LCPRSNGAGASGKFGEYGYLHLVGSQPIQEAYEQPKRREKTDAELDRQFRPIAQAFVDEGWGFLDLLADELTVREESLQALMAGHSAAHYGGSWTFPERNHLKQIIGISYRRPDGSKRQEVGGRRGLYYPDDWLARDGPVNIVEGATDTAAVLSSDQCGVGRPSCTGGLRHLLPLLARVRRPRQVIVWGENDRKAHADLADRIREMHDAKCGGCRTCWPGKAGALALAKQLSDRISASVCVYMPPRGVKDFRSGVCLECNRDP